MQLQAKVRVGVRGKVKLGLGIGLQLGQALVLGIHGWSWRKAAIREL